MGRRGVACQLSSGGSYYDEDCRGPQPPSLPKKALLCREEQLLFRISGGGSGQLNPIWA